MAEREKKPCPECGALNEGDGPFCDNCGFRVGRIETQQEGHAAITRSLADTDIDRPALPKRSRGEETAVEGFDAIGPDLANIGLPEATELEGLAPVSSTLPTEKHPPIKRPSKEADHVVPSLPTQKHPPFDPLDDVATSTDLPRVDADDLGSPDDDSRSYRVLWIGLWIASIVGTLMFADYFLRPAVELAPTPQTSHAPSPTRIAVPAGEFRRGLNERLRATILTTCLKMVDDTSKCDEMELLAEEFPEETVKLSGYAIDSLEVTVGEYEECVDGGTCAAIDWKSCKVYTLQGLQISLRVPRTLQTPHTSATCLSREQAASYCAWRSGRLPTHDEWERAARGTDGRAYPWGSIWDPVAANWGELDVVRMPVAGKIDGYDWVAPPGQFESGNSPVGALDMAGNVWEWVAGDPVAARGGSWTSSPFDLRTTGRLELAADVARTDVGFRCAYDR